MLKIIFLFIVSILLTTNAYSYIGPGVAIGALFGTIGIVIGIIISILFLLYSPIKKLYLKFFKKKQNLKTKKIDKL